MFVHISCHGKKPRENIHKTQVVPVRTAPVIKGIKALPIRLTGRLFSSKEIKLSFKTGGYIERILKIEGQSVKKGSLLAQLELTEISAHFNKAETALNKAQRDLTRISALFEGGTVPLEQMQNAQTGFDIANSDFSIAEFNLNNSKIRAPFNGNILKRLIQEHEMVAPGMPVLIFGTSNKQWIVRTGVTDNDIGIIEYHDSAQIEFSALPERTFTARVTEIGEAADPYTGTFEVELAINDTAGALKSGFICSIDIYPKKQAGLSFIPAAALAEANGNQGTVYSIDTNNMVFPINIRIAGIRNSFLAVSEGLEEVSKVIAEGSSQVSQGIKVIIVE
ncbi:MAG: efflux RND transporter periplasmic adaptor subunit [bacterium]